METLQIEDIQGILIRGYKNLRGARFILCQITDVQAARQLISDLLPVITRGDEKAEEKALNIAFTYKGVQKFNMNLSRNFSEEFQEGMDSVDRQRILGDYNSNDPKYWHWGVRNSGTEIDLIIMLFAPSNNAIDTIFSQVYENIKRSGVLVVEELNSEKLENDREHFGFHDGVSQPVLESMSQKKNATDDNIIADGEFIFGYTNEYGKEAISPTLTNGFDFGKNGSYMVFRQIQQEVHTFWDFMLRHSNQDNDAAIHLAAKMMGRYPSGTPIILSPLKDSEDPEMFMENNFNFYKDDKYGDKCPIGAHIRKANPRDGVNDNPEESTTVSKRHRILRRGRPYGPPLIEDMNVPKMLDAIKAGQMPEENIGLHFICFNTNISRQFEFIQQQWMNNKKFDHLYNDPDPIIGVDGKPPVNGTNKPEPPGEFTLQACPVRKKLLDVPQFTKIKGGAYFFLPGLDALQQMQKS